MPGIPNQNINNSNKQSIRQERAHKTKEWYKTSVISIWYSLDHLTKDSLKKYQGFSMNIRSL